MTITVRKTGIDVLGDMPWGTHFCIFYETKKDLLDTVIPYLKAGLESNEFCMWMISAPLTKNEAQDALSRAVPDLDLYLAQHHIEIFATRDWYFEGEKFDLTRIINDWHQKLRGALDRGYSGMRATGDMFWVETKHWQGVCAYEHELNKAVAQRPMTVLCTYPLAKSRAVDVLDVAQAHHLTFAKRMGQWQVSDSQNLRRAKRRITQAADEPRQHGIKNTRQLLADKAEIEKKLATLTKRERQVFDRIVTGLPNKLIAYDLGLSHRTVEIYRAKAMRKMKAATLSGLVRMASIMDVVRNAPKLR